MNVSTWSIKNPIPALMLFVLLCFGGLLSFNAMKVQQFPDMDLPTIVVSVALPGASPAQLESDVARKIENSIATLQNLKHIYTKVQAGRRVADRVEVLTGLDANASVAVRGAGFLNDGDLVRVAAAPAAAPAAGKQSSSEYFMQKVPVALVDHVPVAIN